MITEPDEYMLCENCTKPMGDALFYEWLMQEEDHYNYHMSYHCPHCGFNGVVISMSEYEEKYPCVSLI